LYLLTVVLCLPGARAADLPVAVDADTEGAAASEHVDVDADLKGTYTADIYQRRISENINNAAQWVDSFFDDDRYIAEDASSKLRFGQSVFLEYGANPKLNTRLNVSLDVPNTEKKLRLFIGSEDDANPTSEQLPDSVDDNDIARDGSSAGVQFFAKASDKQNLSVSAGIKVSSADLFIGPRYRRTVSLDDWLFRFTQRFRWYTGQGWESRTRLDFERLVGQDLFFRQTFDGRWREEDPGYRYESRSSVIQALKSRKAIEYQWANLFSTDPQQRLVSTVFRLRYRQNFLRKWLFYEMNPQLALRNDEHFKPKAGIVLRIEVVFGGKDFLKSGSDQPDDR